MTGTPSGVVGVVDTSGPLAPAEVAAHLGVWRGLRFYRLAGCLATPRLLPPAAPPESDENAPPLLFADDTPAEATDSLLRPREFDTAPDFYTALGDGRLQSGEWVVLHRVAVCDWLPLWPGVIHRQANAAAHAFDAALPRTAELPIATNGTRMVMSGVGTVRLLPTPYERPRFAWYGATFDAVAHTGLPLRLDTWRHGDIFRTLQMQTGATSCDVIGKVYVETAKRPGSVPKLYVDVLQLVERDDGGAGAGVRVTLALAAAYTPDPATPPMWLFGYAAFLAHATDPASAAGWLTAHFGLADRPVLYDCDALRRHFPLCLNPLQPLVYPPPAKARPVAGNRKALAELSLLLRARMSPNDVLDAMRDLGRQSALGEPEALALVTGRSLIAQIEILVEAAARAGWLANLCQMVMLRRPDLAEHLLAWRFRNRRKPARIGTAPDDPEAARQTPPTTPPQGWQQLRFDIPPRHRKAG